MPTEDPPPGSAPREAAVTPLCRACGSAQEVIVYPDDHSLAICPTCCEGAEHPDGEKSHQFDYERGERRHVCRYCGIPRDCTSYVESSHGD